MYSSNQNDFQKYGQPSTVTGFPTAPPPSYPYAAQDQPPSHFQTTTPGHWSTGLCGCSNDVSNCCLTCWCPCITFGRIADIVDKGSTTRATAGGIYALLASLTGCGCIYTYPYRSKMRQQYNLPESPCGDCPVHFFCEPCALCQEHRELQNRGFDMSIGWRENMQKQNDGITMAPTNQGGMSRY